MFFIPFSIVIFYEISQNQHDVILFWWQAPEFTGLLMSCLEVFPKRHVMCFKNSKAIENTKKQFKYQYSNYML